MNLRQRIWWSSFAFLALVVIVAVAGGPLWKRLQAHHDVRELRAGLEYYLQEQGQYPQGTAAEICGLLRGETVKDQNPRKLSYIEAKPREINAAGEFVDPWGHPYHVSPGGVPSVYSNGPNGADESGGGDDISR